MDQEFPQMSALCLSDSRGSLLPRVQHNLPRRRVQGIAEQVFATEPVRPMHDFPIVELAFTSKPEANEHSKPDVL